MSIDCLGKNTVQLKTVTVMDHSSHLWVFKTSIPNQPVRSSGLLCSSIVHLHCEVQYRKGRQNIHPDALPGAPGDIIENTHSFILATIMSLMPEPSNDLQGSVDCSTVLSAVLYAGQN